MPYGAYFINYTIYSRCGEKEDKAMTASDASAEELVLVDILEALLVLTVSSFGFLCNVVSFLIILRHHSFNNSFGYITACHAFSNASILLIFAFWATPWTLFSVPNNVDWLNSFLGQMTLLFVEVSFHCSLLLSMNRFTAVTFPLKYRTWFSDRSTLCMLTLIILLAALYWGAYFFEDCNFNFDHSSRVWKFGEEPCSVFMAFNVDMIYNICIFVIVVIFDSITLMNLKKNKKKFLAKFGHGVVVERESKRQKRREMLLFMQAFLTSCVYSFMLICFHVISAHMPSRFTYFLCTTFVWEASHSLGGVILICFNPEIRRHIVSVRHFFSFLRDPLSNTTTVRPVSTVFSSSHK